MLWLLIIIGPLLLARASIAGPAPAQAGATLGAPLPETSFSRLDVGPPAAAFADGPLQLSPNAERILRARFQGDKVPIVPEPFRRQLDAALAARDWPKILARRSDLGASRGKVAMLMWEQTRLLATGNVWLAELQARDLATAGFAGTSGPAVMMWFYAVAVTMTDGHQCAAGSARDTHLTALRGSSFEPVLTLIRKMPDDQLAQERDTAVKLEAALSAERSDDTVCRLAGDTPGLRPAEEWRADATRTREILTKHLNAFCALVRGKPMSPPSAAAPGSVTVH